jgi:cytochrome bd ubiquinol oxidase subunit II
MDRYKKQDDHYILLARRWARGFVITVAVGVVAGTAIGLQLSLLWPYFMQLAGQIITLPLFMETFAFSIVLTISEGGFITIGEYGPVLHYWTLFTSPMTWSIVLLSITAVLYISAVFLTWYSHHANDEPATKLMRLYSLIWAIPMIITAAGIMVEMRTHNPDHFVRMMDLWWLFALSFLLFIGTFYLIWKRKFYGRALGLLVCQFFLAFFAYGISHYPYLLYPFLSIYDSFTNKAMAISLVIAFIAGLGILLPSLYLLLRLFLFNKGYVEGKRKDFA